MSSLESMKISSALVPKVLITKSPVALVIFALLPVCLITKSVSSPKLTAWSSSKFILWLLVSKSPPSCGVVSLTKSVSIPVRFVPSP